MKEYSLKANADDVSYAKGVGSDPVVITSPIALTTDPAEAWYTTDENDPLIVSAPSGFSGGPRPKPHP